MKYRVLLAFFVLWLSSCSGFLEESSQDEVRPTTAADLMQIMVGEAYPMDNVLDPYTDMLTDDVQCNGSSDKESMENHLERGRPVFSWSRNMFEEVTGVTNLNSWSAYYGRIKGCNVILDYLPRVEGSVEEKENMRGQALVLRAWYYLQLVNLYALPYNSGDPAKNPGVPLKLTMDVTDELFRRNTVAEVYERIETDILAGIKLLEKYDLPMSKYKITHHVAKAMLSRVYLYMEKWDKSLEYSDKVLATQPELTSLASWGLTTTQPQIGLYDEGVSNEIIWLYGPSKEYTQLYPKGIQCIAPYTVSDGLLNKYETSTNVKNYLDLRPRLCFYNESVILTNPTRVLKYARFGWKAGMLNLARGGKGIRTAEMYLNRAEVYVRKYMETGEDTYREKALADLNHLRENRYDTRNEAYVPVDIVNANELFQFYKDERRRELSFEGHRWFDLRRMGMPRLVHEYYYNTNNIQEFVLEENSPRYVLPIPEEAMRRNSNLVQNP